MMHGFCTGMPRIKFVKDRVSDAYQLGKQIKNNFKPKNQVSTSKPLQLIHMNLFGPIDIISLRDSKFAFVTIDDYNMNVLISCMLCPKWLKIWMPLYHEC